MCVVDRVSAVCTVGIMGFLPKFGDFFAVSVADAWFCALSILISTAAPAFRYLE
jgi:hypothetical protein